MKKELALMSNREAFNMDLRTDVLLKSLSLEYQVSSFISQLLSIDCMKDSISFGGSSKALSFNQKINLLIDIGALNKEVTKKYDKFMEIRNKFMHNLLIRTFEECDASYANSELKKFLIKNYPDSANENIEQQLTSGFELLHRDIVNITNNIGDKILAKENLELSAKINNKFAQLYHTYFEKPFDDLNKMWEKWTATSENDRVNDIVMKQHFTLIKRMKKDLEVQYEKMLEEMN
ncbi:hypothetical protein ABIC74_000741 [Mucilaginibacter rubeus]|uniref:hypothetical protein n=1 Tax=Mucilaginibacter rubeus TaxID=2027860 RepID=UPI0033985222